MALLIFTIIVIILAALGIYAVDLTPMDRRLNTALRVLVVIIAMLLIANRAGLV